MLMRHFISAVIFSLLPMVAMAQSYSQAPMLVVGDSQPTPASTAAPADASPSDKAGALASFPENAVTKIGDVASPSKETTGAVKPVADVPANAEAEAEESKLWPKNTLEIFMPRCTGLKLPFVGPCRCVMTKLMSAMPHNEFLKKSKDGTIEQDSRLISIRKECATAPQRKK